MTIALILQLVGAILAGAAVQASLYDVPGGYKAVMFDRFSGVQNKVRSDFFFNSTNTERIRLGNGRGHPLPRSLAATRNSV